MLIRCFPQLAVSPRTYVYTVFHYLIAPLYCNSVLANLNSRSYVRGRRVNAAQTTHTIGFISSALEFAEVQRTQDLASVRSSSVGAGNTD